MWNDIERVAKIVKWDQALGFLHTRTNLSPFTKDFRGEDQYDEYLTIFLRSWFVETDSYQIKHKKFACEKNFQTYFPGH